MSRYFDAKTLTAIAVLVFAFVFVAAVMVGPLLVSISQAFDANWQAAFFWLLMQAVIWVMVRR